MLYYFKYAFSSITFKIKNLYNKDPRIVTFHTFVMSLYLYDMLKLSKTTSPQNCSYLITSHYRWGGGVGETHFCVGSTLNTSEVTTLNALSKLAHNTLLVLNGF